MADVCVPVAQYITRFRYQIMAGLLAQPKKRWTAVDCLPWYFLSDSVYAEAPSSFFIERTSGSETEVEQDEKFPKHEWKVIA